MIKQHLKKVSPVKNVLKWGAVGVMATLVLEGIALSVIATKTNLFKNNPALTLEVRAIILVACAALCAGTGYPRGKAALGDSKIEVLLLG